MDIYGIYIIYIYIYIMCVCISIYAHTQYDIVGVCELVIIRQRRRQPKRQRKHQSKSANNQLVHHAFHL